MPASARCNYESTIPMFSVFCVDLFVVSQQNMEMTLNNKKKIYI